MPGDDAFTTINITLHLRHPRLCCYLDPSVVAADHLQSGHNDCQEHHQYRGHDVLCYVTQGDSQEAGRLFPQVAEQRWKLSDG